MKEKALFLGIDCGSTTAKIIITDETGEILHKEYAYHRGKPYEVLHHLLSESPYQKFSLVGATTSTPYFVHADYRGENKICFIEAVKRRYPSVRNILLVGSEKFARIIFDEQGSYRKIRANSTCAAGTGSFLDQQAVRLGINSAAKLAELASQAGEPIPRIASRCSVFAKTDLIHAQQEGWSLAEISEGLCSGLARNIADTLFPGEILEAPVVMVGGVALNQRVVAHLSQLAHCPIQTDELAPFYGALGALWRAQAAERSPNSKGLSGFQVRSIQEILGHQEQKRSYVHAPLEGTRGNYPSFTAWKSELYVSPLLGEKNPVEVDIYQDLGAYTAAKEETGAVGVHVGIDIGSTSTKAAIMDQDNHMMLGLYTRTAGDPIRAVQGLLDTLNHIQKTYRIPFTVLSCATTGSGRKLIGAIIGADGIIDEITAHARAAVTLDPRVDTIIEIGGQDSKFTVLKDGVVVFSQMNTVCAAGTGSFIEEQANKLGVPIREYADRAFGHPAPATSDRCTVFMERDLNNYQNEGYTVEELLVATLFSVCDNYLSKVAMEGSIGDHIVFQGATAKNKALVAAFERRLGKPIAVSPYCHLTGAMGAILQYQEDCRVKGTPNAVQEAGTSSNIDEKDLAQRDTSQEERMPQYALQGTAAKKSAFKGFQLAYENIEQRNDLCSGCPNHCKLHIITVQGEEIVYGYLCGRGAGDRTYVSRNRSGFDLIRERRALLERCIQRIGNPSQSPKPQNLVERLSSAVVGFSTGTIDLFNDYLHQAAERALQGLSPKETQQDRHGPEDLKHIKIGIPRALYLQEDWRLWQYFFQSLGFTVVPGEDTSTSLIEGKRIAGADFCAPISMIHGQTAALLQTCDYVFMPIYLEAPPRQDQKPATNDGERRFYCNYSQYVPMLISVATGAPERLLRPLVYAPFGKSEQAVEELRESLRPLYQKLGIELPRPSLIEKLLRDIHRIKRAYDETLKELYTKVRPEEEEFAIVLTGRPYTALSKGMNKGIPDLFAEHGLKVFFHDMLPPSQQWQQEHQLQAYHWYYASKVVETALYCRDNPQVYPVLVTSFKCGPDSFAMETFKRILDEAEKPYLILQVDEHDSAVGYETRVEAAVRAFRNHFSTLQRTATSESRGQKKPDPQGEPVDAASSPGSKGSAPPAKIFPRDKTVLLPSWDPLVCQLLAAALRGNGIDAHVLEEKREYIQRAMTYNSGQCIPVSVIAYETKTYIEHHRLDPARTALWMVRALWPCNIPLYPLQLETLFKREGNGLEKVQIYNGDMVFFDVSPRMTLDAYYAFALGGSLRKIGCRIRPYEKIPGSTDSFIQKALGRCIEALEKHQSMTALIQEIGTAMQYIERSEQPRPKVAIFGDFYVRDNEIFNQDLIKAIEKAGGEVVVTSYVEYLKATVDAFFERLLIERRYGPWMAYRTVMAAISSVERRLARGTGVRLSEGSWTNKKRHLAYTYLGLRPEMSGENYDNALKVLKLLDEYPDINLFVQAAPAFCCASLVTEGMSQAIENLTGVPVLTITYDGTGAYKNDLVEPYLAKYGT